MRDDLTSLGIERVECEREVVNLHVDGFIDAFIVAESRTRVRKAMRRVGWRGAANQHLLVERLDRRLCVLDEDQSRPAQWPAEYLAPGVYVDDVRDGLRLGVADAAALAQVRGVAGLFSVVPGRLAILFNFEWGVWYCRRPASARN